MFAICLTFLAESSNGIGYNRKGKKLIEDKFSNKDDEGMLNLIS